MIGRMFWSPRWITANSFSICSHPVIFVFDKDERDGKDETGEQRPKFVITAEPEVTTAFHVSLDMLRFVFISFLRNYAGVVSSDR
jgi:hypothetical protein